MSAQRRLPTGFFLLLCLAWAGACSNDDIGLQVGDQAAGGGSGGSAINLALGGNTSARSPSGGSRPAASPSGGVAGPAGAVDAGSGVSTGGSSGSAPTRSGTTTGTPWPRPEDNPTLATASGLGPYQYESYDRGFPISNQAFSSATIFYPTSAKPPFSAVALCPGFTEVEHDFLTWGMLLASHGIVALVLTPKDTFTDSPENRGDELLAALDTLASENLRSQGPLRGQVATDRLGVMGHSMGGGGSLFACNKGSARIKAVVALMPWQPGGTYPKCTSPTLVVAAQKDGLVSPEGMALPEYQSLAATEKVFMNVAGTDHNTANDISGGGNIFARYALSWLKVHLEEDNRYQSFLSGEAHQADVAANRFIKFIP